MYLRSISCKLLSLINNNNNHNIKIRNICIGSCCLLKTFAHQMTAVRENKLLQHNYCWK